LLIHGGEELQIGIDWWYGCWNGFKGRGCFDGLMDFVDFGMVVIDGGFGFGWLWLC
jgi:hypothetical protein